MAALSDETVKSFNWIRDKYHTKGIRSLRLEWDILRVCKGYSKLTVRQLYYLLSSRFGYPATRNFYKRVVYHSKKMRRRNPELNKKFIDPTRILVRPALSFGEIELWVEKDSIRNFIGKLAAKYRLSVQVLRGFASLSMFRRALERAKKRDVKLIIYLGDWDPSGLDIQRASELEMDHKLGIRFIRLAITWEQIQRLKPPSRPVNRNDPRAEAYIEKYGDRCWEIEAIRPRTLFRIVREGLKTHVPKEFLEEAAKREKAARLARPITERLRKAIEKQVLTLLAEGVAEQEIVAQIAEKFGVKIGRRKKK